MNAKVKLSKSMTRNPIPKGFYGLPEFERSIDAKILGRKTYDRSLEMGAAALKRSGVPLVKDVHETAWATREFVIKDEQGHTLYFGESL